MRLNNVTRQLVFIITDRPKVARVLQMVKQHEIIYYEVVFARGTVSSRWLKYLGLDDTERAMIFIPYIREDVTDFLDYLDEQLQLQKPGSGIAFAIDTDCVFGCAVPEDTIETKEMNMHKLMTIIVDDSYAEDVMDVARAAGAKGGTIVHARGNSDDEVETVFGMQIEPQREILFILAENSEIPAIEQAVAKYLDEEQPGGIMFMQDVQGIRGLATNR